MSKPFKPGDKVVYIDGMYKQEVLTVKWCGKYNELQETNSSYDGRLVVIYEECAGFDWCKELRLLTPLEELL